MKHAKFMRRVSMALALILLCAAIPVGALAAQTENREQPNLEITAEHVVLDQTRFEYTGEEIRPNVTVRVGTRLLTLDKEYTLTFRNNVEAGTATLIVEALPNTQPVSYTGKVEIPFYIDPKTSDDSAPNLIAIVGSNVLIDGTEFTATGEPVTPGITVTVSGQELTAGEDYTLLYENNLLPGTASVTVTGVADKGYTGSVTIHFTIQAAPETPTEPEQTQPEQTDPEEAKPVSYKITKGNSAIWRKNSGKTLSFASDGAFQDFEGLEVNGRTVNSKYYTVKEGSTVITLNESFLQRLELGKYTLTLQFTDGEAEGSFTVAAPADDSNPKTGDDFALHSWIALLFISLTGIIGAAFAYRKHLFK